MTDDNDLAIKGTLPTGEYNVEVISRWPDNSVKEVKITEGPYAGDHIAFYKDQ